MTNTPTLQTPRLILRRFTAADLEDFLTIYSNEQVCRFLPIHPLRSQGEAGDFFRGFYCSNYAQPQGYDYALCLKSDNRPIGFINIDFEDARQWSRSIASNSCCAAGCSGDGCAGAADRSVSEPGSGINISSGMGCELGYGLLPQFWGQGLMTEACRAVLARLREDGFSFVFASHDVTNEASGQVLQRLGMTYQYSWEEQWQPKNIKVLFRLYLISLDQYAQRTFPLYWTRASVRMVEDLD